MNSIKRLALAAFAALIILVGLAPAAHDDAANIGNFNPYVALDISQVEAQSSEAEMFCFESIDDTGWVCYNFADIPAEYSANNYEHIVWSGPVSGIEDAYNKYGRN